MIWERFRRIDPRYVDTALVVLLLPIYFGWAARQELLAASLPVAAAQTFPLLVRRRYPVHVLAVVVAATVTANLAFGSLLPFAAFLALYTVAANRERGVALRVGFLGLAALSLPLLRSSGWGFAEFAFRLVTFAAALAFGDGIRTRRAYVGELEARAERLEREREENVR